MSSIGNNYNDLSDVAFSDVDAYHFNEADEFTQSSQKTMISPEDNIILEDSEDSYNKKFGKFKNLPNMGKVFYDMYTGITPGHLRGNALAFFEPSNIIHTVNFPEVINSYFKVLIVVKWPVSATSAGKMRFNFGPNNRLFTTNGVYTVGTELETEGVSLVTSACVLTAVFPDPNNPNLCNWALSDKFETWGTYIP